MTDKKFAEDITVDCGQPIIVTVTFEEDPDDVFFSHTRPREERSYVDDGYGRPKSRIERLGQLDRNSDAVSYRCTFSTKGFEAGDGEWHFWGEWRAQTKHRPYDEASIFGHYHVNAHKVY